MHYKPLGNKLYIILEPVKENVSTGGIALPDNHSEMLRIATIKGIGDRVEGDLKVGDKVLVSYHVGTVLDSPIILKSGIGDTHRIVTSSEIWFKAEE